MATGRLLRASKPLSGVNSSSSSSPISAKSVRCMNNVGFKGEKAICSNGEQKKRSTGPVKASVATSDCLTVRTETDAGLLRGLDPASLLANFTNAVLKVVRPIVKRRRLKFQELHIQTLIETVIMNCRFLTLFAVGGSLIGSVLCFVEGCFRIMETYLLFFISLSQKADQGHIVHLIIEAIDMFLFGTAMLIFGVGVYVLFVGSKNNNMKGISPTLPVSDLFGHFKLKTLPKWVELESVSQAKSKIGHAMMMILQVGLLEKFNSIPLLTCLDLLCFAGAVLISSAAIFLLSRLSGGAAREHS